VIHRIDDIIGAMTRTAGIVVAFALAACKPASPQREAALVELTSSVDALHREFDAHAQEARFLTLLAPT